MSEIPPELDTSLADCLLQHLTNGRVKEALEVTADNRFHACLKSNCYDTIAVLAGFLKTATFEANPQLYQACEDILKTVTNVASPQEVLLEILAVVEACEDDNQFRSALKSLQVCILRLPENKILSIDHAFEAVYGYVEKLPLADDSREPYAEERQKLLENEKNTTRFLTNYVTLTLFLEPIRDEFLKIPLLKSANFPVNTRRGVLLKFLMKLLGNSFARLHLKAEEKPINTYSRQCSGFLVDSITALLGGDPFCILPWIEERFRWLKQKEGKNCSIFLSDNIIPTSSLFIFFYAVFVGRQIPAQSPRIYSPVYIFEIMLYLITPSLESDLEEVKMKAVELLQVILANLELETLSSSQLELQIHANLCLGVTNLMIFSTSEEIRKTSIAAFKGYLVKFDDEGRFLIIEKLFEKYSSNSSNLRGFLTTQFKDFVAEILSRDENRFAVQERFLRIMKRHLTTLKDKEATDLVQEAEAIIACLNTIRFLALRDHENRTSFWDLVPDLQENYLHFIRQSMDLGRVHYEAERTKIVNCEDEELSEKISVDVVGERLPKLTRDQKLYVMNNSLMKLDVIESVLARVHECLKNNTVKPPSSTIDDFRAREEAREAQFEETHRAQEAQDQVNPSPEATENPEEERVRGEILKAALQFATSEGWTREAITKGAESAGFPGVAHGMFPDGGVELIQYFYSDCNARLVEWLRKETEGVEKVPNPTQFVCRAIETRLRMLQPFLSTWPQAIGILSLPQNAPKALANLLTLADDICYYSGDKAVNVSHFIFWICAVFANPARVLSSWQITWYTRRVGVAGIIKITELYMLQDKSVDHQNTWKFLERRMEDAVFLHSFFTQSDEAKSHMQKAITSAFETRQLLHIVEIDLLADDEAAEVLQRRHLVEAIDGNCEAHGEWGQHLRAGLHVAEDAVLGLAHGVLDQVDDGLVAIGLDVPVLKKTQLSSNWIQFDSLPWQALLSLLSFLRNRGQSLSALGHSPVSIPVVDPAVECASGAPEAQRELILVRLRVAQQEGAVQLRREPLLGGIARQRAPIPAVLGQDEALVAHHLVAHLVHVHVDVAGALGEALGALGLRRRGDGVAAGYHRCVRGRFRRWPRQRGLQGPRLESGQRVALAGAREAPLEALPERVEDVGAVVGRLGARWGVTQDFREALKVTLSLCQRDCFQPAEVPFLTRIFAPTIRREMEEKETPVNRDEEERMLQSPSKDHVVPSTATYQFTPVVEKKKTFLDTLLDIFGSSSKSESKASESKKKRITLLAIVLLLMGLVISATGLFIMWFTEIYNDTLISRLVLKENTLAAEWWANPPLHSYLKVYVFNYTNVDRFLVGTDKKLHVEEVGPYVYYEKLTKEHIVFNGNNTISYREKRVNRYLPEMSTGSDMDNVIVPNIPMLTAMKKIKGRNVFVQMALDATLKSTQSTVFKNLPVNEFLWGYEDGLISISKAMLPIDEQPPFEKFGLLINRNATSWDNFTIHSGEGDIRQLAVILSLNGKKTVDFWAGDECNRMGGTDGSQFPPHFLRKKDKLEVYIKDMCRKFPLEYEKDVTLFDGIPAWRYRAPDDVFAHPSENEDNKCYCHKPIDECPKSGLFNSSVCAYGAPIYLSFPHFFTGDERLHDKIVGLKPDPEKHVTYADIHPRLAFPINGASRFQINVEVFSPTFVSGIDPLEEGDILPVLWLEVIPGEFSDELISLIFHSSFSANAVQIGLRYGSLLLTATFLALLIGVWWHRGKNSKQ
ncbi:uncharacterized protein LOC132260689 [Phlebotomus argentipes]|uniref:uncharacterized protein LOC132260689 n=1 Tax=Phlebotomus argentipes TaxID=94469 RepID=UPI002892BE14|nr:uncharacterized protein LOC132260689 [Phlebotomus argentipes]